MFIIVEGPPPCQSGVWIFEFSAVRRTVTKVFQDKGFYMEPYCEKPVKVWGAYCLDTLDEKHI
jgi:hypothetical protein